MKRLVGSSLTNFGMEYLQYPKILRDNVSRKRDTGLSN